MNKLDPKPWENQESLYQNRYLSMIERFKLMFGVKYTDPLEDAKNFFIINRYSVLTDFVGCLLIPEEKEAHRQAGFAFYYPDPPSDSVYKWLIEEYCKISGWHEFRVREFCADQLRSGKTLPGPLVDFVGKILLREAEPLHNRRSGADIRTSYRFFLSCIVNELHKIWHIDPYGNDNQKAANKRGGIRIVFEATRYVNFADYDDYLKETYFIEGTNIDINHGLIRDAWGVWKDFF